MAQILEKHPKLSLWKMPHLPSNSPSIRTLPEGTLGKLVIRQSGKTQIHMGSIRLDMERVETAMKQHLVKYEKPANLIDLGSIQDCALFYPDWAHLLK